MGLRKWGGLRVWGEALDSVNLSVTEQFASFSESSQLTIVEPGNIALSVTEVTSSFIDSSSVTIAKDVALSITETFSAFIDNSSIQFPASWTDKPPASNIWITKG